MALIVREPATLFDMAEMSGAGTRTGWMIAREMWRGGETFALQDGDQLIGLFGLYPIEGGAEAWFNVRPEAAKHVGFIIRQIRLTLVSRDYPEIVVLCTSKAGRTIARRLGFRFVQTVDYGEIWHGEFVRRRQQGGGPVECAGEAERRAAAAAHAG